MRKDYSKYFKIDKDDESIFIMQNNEESAIVNSDCVVLNFWFKSNVHSDKFYCSEDNKEANVIAANNNNGNSYMYNIS